MVLGQEQSSGLGARCGVQMTFWRSRMAVNLAGAPHGSWEGRRPGAEAQGETALKAGELAARPQSQGWGPTLVHRAA